MHHQTIDADDKSAFSPEVKEGEKSFIDKCGWAVTAIIDGFWARLMPLLKYLFHFALVLLMPLVHWRFFLRYSDFSMMELLACLTSMSAFAFMA